MKQTYISSPNVGQKREINIWHEAKQLYMPINKTTNAPLVMSTVLSSTFGLLCTIEQQ